MNHFTLVLMAAATLCTQGFAQNRVKNIYTSSSALNISLLQSSNQDVQINRTLLAGYNTVCLPMTLSAEQLAATAKDIQVERLAAIRQEGSTLYLYFLDCTHEGIKAGTPYLLFTPNTQIMRAKVSQSQTVDTALKSVCMRDDNGNQITFGSSWESLQVDGRYGIPAQQDSHILESVLIRTEADKTFLPTRCGFTWDKQNPTATTLEIKHVTSLDGIETSIENLQATGAIVDVYDTKGTLIKKQVGIENALKNLPRGIYVIGGEKVAVQ